MLKRWWVFPLLLGLPAGVLIGAWRCGTSPLFHLYADCHLYRLLTGMLAAQVALPAALVTGLGAVLLLGLAATRRAPRWLALVLRLLLPLAALTAAGLLFLPAVALEAIRQFFTNPDVVRFGSLGLGLIVLAWVLWRLRHRPAPATAPSSPAPSRIAALTRKASAGVALLGCALFIAIQLAAGVYWALAAASARNAPNVILIMVCSLRADHLGCYGYDLPTSPNLDRFAAASTRFAHAAAPSSWTLWSTAAVLTGRYPERIFRTSDYMAADAVYPGLPSVLANRGYATNYLSDHPFLRNDLNFNYSQDFAYHRTLGMDDFTQKLAPAVTAQALERIRELNGRTFFMYLMYADPHDPYTQHPEFVFDPSTRDALDPRWATTLPPTLQHMDARRLTGLLASDAGDAEGKGASRQRRLARYNSEIAFTDHAIGQFLDGLKRQGRYDDSLIIVCGDHGEEFLEHGRYGHQYTLNPEVLHVPLLVKAPGQRSGTVIDGRFPLIDLYPSLLAMLRLDDSRLRLHGDGTDLSTLLRCADKPTYHATVNKQRSQVNRDYAYYRGTRMHDTGGAPFESAMTFFLDEPIERLFDLRTDPGLYHDILPQARGTAVSLSALVRRHDAELDALMSEATAGRAASADETRRALEQLKSLGYLQQ